jgi:hypothetical protein
MTDPPDASLVLDGPLGLSRFRLAPAGLDGMTGASAPFFGRHLLRAGRAALLAALPTERDGMGVLAGFHGLEYT